MRGRFLFDRLEYGILDMRAKIVIIGETTVVFEDD